jgi:PAS domain S-box-containing protein
LQQAEKAEKAEDVTDAQKSRGQLLAEIAELRSRLAEPEETVQAIRHGEVDAFVVLDAAGERILTFGTAELLRLLQLVTDSLPVLVSYVDRERRYRFVNRRYGDWFGRPLAEIMGAALWEVAGEAAYESIRTHVDRALAGGEVTYETSAVPYQGTEPHWLHATYVPHVHDGEVQGFVAFIEDVSERKRAGDSLRLLADAGRILSETLRGEETLAEAARLVVPRFADWCVIDLVTAAGGSERVVSLHADPERQPLMEELKRFPPPLDRGSIQADVLRSGEPAFFPRRQPQDIEARLRGADHARCVALLAPRSILCVPLVARGRKLGTWSFAYGESGRRYREDDVRVAQELGRRFALGLDNARLFREAEAANSAKDHFLATLSHELRTPLTPVLAVAARLDMDGSLPAGARAGLDMIRRNVELEARLIDDLLDLTRITRGKLELDRQPTDLRQVIRQAVETCGERELAARALALDLAAGDHRVWGDSSRLTQVFWNLLNNALKFTPPGGTISVRSYLEGSYLPPGQPPSGFLVVEVADSGIGIDPDDLPRIFDAFDRGRGSGSGRGFGGLGLGLAIGRSIVEQHGGSLTAASAGPGRGSTLTVRLPQEVPNAAADAAGAAATGAGAPLPETPSAPAGDRQLRLLLIEDHVDTAEALAHLLTDLGHQVTVTGTVAASLAAAAADTFDLVVSDLGLPDGDGYDLMRTLAARHGLIGIALSGYGMEEDVARSRAAGFACHLTKPMSLDTLRAALRRAARPPDTATPGGPAREPG